MNTTHTHTHTHTLLHATCKDGAKQERGREEMYEADGGCILFFQTTKILSFFLSFVPVLLTSIQSQLATSQRTAASSSSSQTNSRSWTKQSERGNFIIICIKNRLHLTTSRSRRLCIHFHPHRHTSHGYCARLRRDRIRSAQHRRSYCCEERRTRLRRFDDPKTIE